MVGKKEFQKDEVYDDSKEVRVDIKALKCVRRNQTFSLHLNCGRAISPFFKKNLINAHNQKTTKANGSIKSFCHAIKLSNTHSL